MLLTESEENTSNENRVRVRLSQIQFPENCPVCMDPAEDLVLITIIESTGPGSYESRSMIKGNDKIAAALQSAISATTFAVPTCMAHGSKSVRTTRTRSVAIGGFFLLFYPLIFFLLQINAALIYSRPLSEPVLGALFFIAAMLGTILYGLFPRALERDLKFENTSRTKDSVDAIIKNREYRELFCELNSMFVDNSGSDSID